MIRRRRVLYNVMQFVVSGDAGFTGDIPVTLRTVISDTGRRGGTETRWFRLEQVSESCAGNEWVVQTLDGPLGTSDRR